MAEYEERSLDDLTEEPSQHRLEELRSKGQVVHSRELTGTLALMAVMMALYFLSDNFVASTSQWMKEIFTKDLLAVTKADGWRSYIEVGTKAGKVMMGAFLPIAMAGLVIGVLTSVAQVGFLFTTQPLTPDLKRLDPISGFTRLFSMKTVVEMLKTILKFTIICGVVYLTLKSEIFVMPAVISYGTSQLMGYIGSTTVRVFGVVVLLLLGAAGIDYYVQWRRFRKQAMMTKSEAKQELKEREGDPHIKARIRSVQRDMARKRMMKDVPRADVVITNPTHIAIAIIYSPAEGHAPKVIAKGADFLAERIKKVAREHGIPTVENKPLARTLYKHVKVGQMIPRSLYQAVAEILAYVYKLKGKSVKNSQRPEI